MSWHPYDLDHLAQRIVLEVREQVHGKPEEKGALNQAYKMRANCAYGLERFWGEHLRLKRKEPIKAEFVAKTWRAFVGVMSDAGVKLPKEMCNQNDSKKEIEEVTKRLWSLAPEDRQASLAVLTNLCDSIVWWTQRLKPEKEEKTDG